MSLKPFHEFTPEIFSPHFSFQSFHFHFPSWRFRWSSNGRKVPIGWLRSHLSFQLLYTKDVENQVIECYTTSDPGLVHSRQLLPVQMQLLFAGRSLKRADALMPLSDANLSQAAHVFKCIFNGRYQCLHCKINVPFRYECFNHLELYSKSVTKVLQGTHNSWETLPLHIRPFPRGCREGSSVNALNCKSMSGLPCAHCILPLTNQTEQENYSLCTRIDSSPYAHLSPSWQMENCPLMRRLRGRPDRMITVKKGKRSKQQKQSPNLHVKEGLLAILSLWF